MVVWTAAIFERLFSEFLARLLVSRGQKWVEARQTITENGRRTNLTKQFKRITGTPFEKAVDEFGVRGLYHAWQETKKQRNYLLHSSPTAVGPDTAERAFEVAKNVIGLFAFLQNKYCIVPAFADVVPAVGV